MYCVSITFAILFNPSNGAIIDHCQSEKDTVFYVEDLGLGPPAMDVIQTTTFWSTIYILPLGLHRPLQIWKRVMSGNGISLDSQTLWRTFPVFNISEFYMFIQNSWLTKLPDALKTDALKEHEKILKSRFLSTEGGDHLDSLVIFALHKYILKNILYWKNDRQKIL